MGFMCKLIGSLLVVVGSCGFAYTANNLLEQRMIDLRKLYSILLQLKSEMQYMGNPLPECFERLKKGSSEAFFMWLEQMTGQLNAENAYSMFEVWTTGCDLLYENSALEQRDIVLLKDLADKLGISDVTVQLKAIDYTLLQLEQNRSELERGMREKKKVITSLTLFAGALTLILLL